MADLSLFQNWPKKGKLNVTIIGAGNLGHVMIGMYGSRPDVDLSFLSRKVDAVREGFLAGVKIRMQSADPTKEDTFVTGKCVRVSSNPADVIPSADFVIITVPSHARAKVMAEIAPHINPNKAVFIGVTPGMGGFDWIAQQRCALQGLKNVIIWGLKDVPYMSAHTVPGKSATNLGPKKDLYLALATDPSKSDEREKQEMEAAKHVIQTLCKINVVTLSNFMVITLTPGNPIMHPAIMYGMFGPYSQWDGKPLPEQPLFYEGVSELSSYFLQKCDTEVQLIKRKIESMTGLDLTPVWPLRENIKKVYGELVGDNRTLMQTMRTNRAYATIRTPLKKVDGGFVPMIDHRFFLEDVPFGLVVLHDMAAMVGVHTPMIDEILLWTQGLMGKEYLVDGRLNGKNIKETGAPRVFGVANVWDLVKPKAQIKAKL